MRNCFPLTALASSGGPGSRGSLGPTRMKN